MSNAQAYGSGVTYTQPITRRTAGKVAAGTLAAVMAGMSAAPAHAEETTPVPATNIGQHVLQLEEGQTRPLSKLNEQLKMYGLEIVSKAEAERELSARYGLGNKYQNAQQANGGSQTGEEAGTSWYKNPKVMIPIVAGGVTVGYLKLRGGGNKGGTSFGQ